MAGIFVNYRKGDHTGVVEAVHRELLRHFGQDQVFLDLPSMLPGDRYPDALRWRVLACEVLLVVIHADWLAAADQHGTRLVDRERDWVREEIEIALKAGKPVIPVLLGDARPPASQDLPWSIRDLALRQAHRIRHGSFGPDVERLASRLEQYVAPTWLPPMRPVSRVRHRPGRWLAWVTAVVSTALVLVPAIRWINIADPSDPDELAAATGLCAWMIFMMTAPLLAIPVSLAVIYPFRARIDSLDRDLQTMPAARFNHFSIPLLLLWCLFGTALIVGNSNNWRTALPVGLFIYVVCFFVAGFHLMREEKRQAEAQANWPQPLPSLSVPALRFAVEQLRARVTEWRTPLSREQRDKSWWSLAVLSDGVDELDAQGRQSRLRGQVADYPWLTSAYTVWAAFAMSLVCEQALPSIYWRTATLRHYVTPVAVALIIGAVSMGSVEAVYHYRRWNLLRPATELRKNIAELGERLLLDGLDHIPWEHVRDAYGPATEVPRLLRLVASGDPAAQRAAVDDLYDRLLYRDTVAEATGCAVPFLANLGTGPHLAAQTRSRLVFLLARIAVAQRYFSPDDAEPVGLDQDTAGSEQSASEPNWVTRAKAAVDAAAPRLFERLRLEREQDTPSLIALAAAAPSAPTPRLVSDIEQLAEREHHAVGAAATIALAVLREQTLSPDQLLATANGNAAVTAAVQRSLDRHPLPMVARKTAIELAAIL